MIHKLRELSPSSTLIVIWSLRKCISELDTDRDIFKFFILAERYKSVFTVNHILYLDLQLWERYLRLPANLNIIFLVSTEFLTISMQYLLCCDDGILLDQDHYPHNLAPEGEGNCKSGLYFNVGRFAACGMQESVFANDYN